MNNNIKIAKQILKLAKQLIAYPGYRSPLGNLGVGSDYELQMVNKFKKMRDITKKELNKILRMFSKPQFQENKIAFKLNLSDIDWNTQNNAMEKYLQQKKNIDEQLEEFEMKKEQGELDSLDLKQYNMLKKQQEKGLRDFIKQSIGFNFNINFVPVGKYKMNGQPFEIKPVTIKVECKYNSQEVSAEISMINLSKALSWENFNELPYEKIDVEKANDNVIFSKILANLNRASENMFKTEHPITRVASTNKVIKVCRKSLCAFINKMVEFSKNI